MLVLSCIDVHEVVHFRITVCRCFIVDNSGFIVVHKYFTEPPIGEQVAVENQHITQMEPVIAKDMVDSNILKKGACTNMENFRNQFSWQVLVWCTPLDSACITHACVCVCASTTMTMKTIFSIIYSVHCFLHKY